MVTYQLGNGGDTSYPNIDVDGDGTSDKVVRSCGASLDATCILFIDLSGGKSLELEEEHFFLARLKSLLYVIVGERLSTREKSKRGKRRIYQITKQDIKLICQHI